MKEKYDKRKLNHRARQHYYHVKRLIKRINYLDPEDKYSFEDKEVIWCKGLKNEHKGWCSCNLQLVCPYVLNYRSDTNDTILGKCKRECHDEKKRKAIEAFITFLFD